MTRAVEAAEGRFRGEPAVILRSGDLSSTFLPALGLTGVSLRYRGGEYLALPGGLDTLRAGGSAGIPLLAPWANRLAARRYRAAGVSVDLKGMRLGTDDNGLPIHGLLARPFAVAGRPAFDARRRRGPSAPRSTWTRRRSRSPTGSTSGCGRASRGSPSTPPSTATGRRRVPVAFGWHPYLRVPGTSRARWRLRLPPREHRALDTRSIPTGASTHRAGRGRAIGRRTFDDLYGLGRDRRFAFEGEDGRGIEMRCVDGYPFAQVWVPAGRTFGALEPMAAPTNALVEGTTPLVGPGDSFTARFALTVS